jgi:hypothetical protein
MEDKFLDYPIYVFKANYSRKKFVQNVQKRFSIEGAVHCHL